MSIFASGDPRSTGRYVAFGAVGGVLAAVAAVLFDVSLPIAGLAAGIIASLAAGTGRGKRLAG